MAELMMLMIIIAISAGLILDIILFILGWEVFLWLYSNGWISSTINVKQYHGHGWLRIFVHFQQ